MKRALFALSILALGASAFGASRAATHLSLSPKPVGGEVAFVRGIQADLSARFPTAAEAEKAGYFRYTNEDDTGAISNSNLAWTSNDPQHPSQLWYDVKGKLLGADFSVPYDAAKRPSLWGVRPERWDAFKHPHVHYILRDANGALSYGATSGTKFLAAGGTLKDPQAATLVKMGVAKNADAVARVFTFPAIWDLIVWVAPNPNGAFAETNPLVKPTKSAKPDSM